MFTVDLFSSIPTDNPSAQAAYDAYWAVATSECNALASGSGPIYRYARDLMIRAIMRDYGLSIAEVAWLYEQVLPEGPGWGSLDRMVAYGRDMAFGRLTMARAFLNCLTCREATIDRYESDDALLAPSRAHAIDCPLRTEGN